jgi:hypothetical protein
VKNSGNGELQIYDRGGKMSFKNLIDSLELAKTKPFYMIKGGAPEKVLMKAEELLGFKLSKQHRTFFSKVGYLSFDGFEFFGICSHDLSGKDALCAVETTIKERVKYNLPNSWVLFCSFDDGYMGYLDYSNINKEGEPPLVMAYSDGNDYNKVKIVSSDIGSYIMECLKSI